MKKIKLSDKKAWLPNSITFGNLLCGLMCIFTLIHPLIVITELGSNFNRYLPSCLLIIIAFCLDGLDGSVARWLKVSNPIGKHLDSFADLVTFGIAPVTVSYAVIFAYNIEPLDIILWSSPAYILILLSISLYVLCATFRLARFISDNETDFFYGLPSPAGAICIVIIILTYLVGYLKKLIYYINPYYFYIYFNDK